MFLLRSAFWLTVAFIAFHPRDVDLGATATALSGQAMAAGQRIVVSELLKQDCLSIHCGTALAPAAAAATTPPPAITLPMQAAAGRSAPFPRPRPAWLG